MKLARLLAAYCSYKLAQLLLSFLYAFYLWRWKHYLKRTGHHEPWEC